MTLELIPTDSRLLFKTYSPNACDYILLEEIVGGPMHSRVLRTPNNSVQRIIGEIKDLLSKAEQPINLYEGVLRDVPLPSGIDYTISGVRQESVNLNLMTYVSNVYNRKTWHILKVWPGVTTQVAIRYIETEFRLSSITTLLKLVNK